MVLMSNTAVATGGWVIERDDRGESPLTKERKAIAAKEEKKTARAYAIAYRKALTREQNQIARHWPQAEITGKTRWVNYSDDYSVKKVVDFERDLVVITLPSEAENRRLDFSKLNRAVNQQLQKTLSTTVKQALDADPITQALLGVHERLKGEKIELQAPDRLVLSQLFDSRYPSATEIRYQAGQLMKEASVQYQNQSASRVTVPLGPDEKLTYIIPIPKKKVSRNIPSTIVG